MIRRRIEGFTVVELPVVVASIGVLAAVLLPAIQVAREGARGNVCRNNLRQSQLALASYDAQSARLPGYSNELFNRNGPKSSPGSGFPPMPTQGRRASWIVMLFPYMEQHFLWDKWSTTFGNPPPAPGIEMLTCPSDAPEIPTEPWCSYVGNSGQAFTDGTRTSNFEYPADGVFVDDNKNPNFTANDDGREDFRKHPRVMMSLAYIQANDGLNTTCMLSENLHAWYYSYGLNNDASPIRDTKHLFGFVWKNVDPARNQPHAIERINGDRNYDQSAPPQSMDSFAVLGNSGPPFPYESYGYPSSNHPGGVNVAFCSGQVVLLAETIDPLVYAQLCTTNQNRSSLVGPGNVPDRQLRRRADNAY